MCNKIETIIIPILQIRKLRIRANNQSQKPNPTFYTSRAALNIKLPSQ